METFPLLGPFVDRFMLKVLFLTPKTKSQAAVCVSIDFYVFGFSDDDCGDHFVQWMSSPSAKQNTTTARRLLYPMLILTQTTQQLSLHC